MPVMTPGRWFALVGAILLLLIGGIAVGSFVTPILLKKLAVSRGQTETATDTGTGRELETGARNAVDAKANTNRLQIDVIQRGAAVIQREVYDAPDANAPLDPARADRQRRHIELVCANRPSVCGPSPEGDANGPDAGALSGKPPVE